jgi:hypothetical protein
MLALRSALVPAAIGLAFLLGAIPLSASVAQAEDRQEVTFVFKNHKIVPDKLKLPAGMKFKFIIQNQDDAAEEFESVRLNREKVVPAGGQIVVLVGPLSPGVYDYFGDFHPDTARGELTIE